MTTPQPPAPIQDDPSQPRHAAEPVDRASEQDDRYFLSAYSGPIPPPEVLLGYKQIDSSLPDIIIRRWGAEQDHRHQMEYRHLEHQATLAGRGQVLGAILGISGILGAAAIGVWGGPIAGPAAASAIIGLITAVLGGVYYLERKAQKRDVGSQESDPQ